MGSWTTSARVASSVYNYRRTLLQNCIGHSTSLEEVQTTVRPPVPTTPSTDTVHRVGDFRPISRRVGNTFTVANQSNLQELVLSRVNAKTMNSTVKVQLRTKPITKSRK